MLAGLAKSPTKCISKLDTLIVRQIYLTTDSMSAYPNNGKAGMFAFISKNTKYQENFVITGTVYISFVVETDGTLKHKKLIKGTTDDINKDALSTHCTTALKFKTFGRLCN